MVITLLTADAFANTPTTYGYGSRSSAMAGAMTANATDFSANFYNPAGLASAEGLEFSFGYAFHLNSLRIDGRDTDVDDIRGVHFGIVAPGELLGIPFAFGLATHLPDDGLSRITALRQEVPRWELYDHRNALLFLATNLAIRPVSWLEIGGGVAFLAATEGRFTIGGRADVVAPNNSQLRHEVDADLTSVRYPQLGLRALLADWGAFGLTYRGQSQLELELAARLEGIVDFAGIEVPLLYLLESRTIDGFKPQELTFGMSFFGVDGFTASFDVAFVNWAAYESPTARTTATLDAQVPDGLPIELPGDLAAVDVLAPEFENRLVPRLGLEYVFGDRAMDPDGEGAFGVLVPVRGGYAYEASPVPPQTGFTNFVDTDRHTMTMGSGIGVHGLPPWLPDRLTLNVHAQLSVMPERTIEKTSPSDFVGSYRADGTMVGGSATLRAVLP